MCEDLKGKCAPASITWLPPGPHLGWPSPEYKLVVITSTPAKAAQMTREIALMRAKAARGEGVTPHLDFAHAGGFAGEVRDAWWDPLLGIRLEVAWTAETAAAIVRCGSLGFSPAWSDGGSKFIGLHAAVGGVLEHGESSAFRHVPGIHARTKLRDLQMKSERFLQLVDAEWRAHPEVDVMAAWALIKGRRPDLSRAHALLRAVYQEMQKVSAL